MGSYYLISALLLLFVAGSGSQQSHEDSTISDKTIPTSEALISLSNDFPSVKQLEVATPALSADPGVTSVPVAKAEELHSQEPNTASNSVASSASTIEDFVTKAPTTGLSDQSSTFQTVDLPTKPYKDEADRSEIPTVDHNATNPSTANNETDNGDDEGYGAPDVTVRNDDTEDGDFSNGSGTTKPPGQETSNGGTGRNASQEKKKKQLVTLILIGVIIFVLVLLLAIMAFFMLRKKKRSGSFRTHSKKNARQNVWAGQVPELGDGKAAQEVVENGTSGTGAEAAKEEEMTTFVTGEKKVDSMVEMNELGSGEKPEANGGEKLSKEATVEEKTPLLEEASEVPPKANDTEEQFLYTPME